MCYILPTRSEDRATQRCDPSAVAGDRTGEGQGFGPALAFRAHPVVPNAINLPFVVAVPLGVRPSFMAGTLLRTE